MRGYIIQQHATQKKYRLVFLPDGKKYYTGKVVHSRGEPCRFPYWSLRALSRRNPCPSGSTARSSFKKKASPIGGRVNSITRSVPGLPPVHAVLMSSADSTTVSSMLLILVISPGRSLFSQMLPLLKPIKTIKPFSTYTWIPSEKFLLRSSSIGTRFLFCVVDVGALPALVSERGLHPNWLYLDIASGEAS